MKDEYLKFYFSDGWVHTYDNDACVMSTIFNYRSFNDMQTGLLCVGFPTSTLSRVVRKLQALRVSYMFVNYKEEVFKDFGEENTYNLYLDSYVPRNNKIEVGDAVVVENANTKKLEKFVIAPTFDYVQSNANEKWGVVSVLETDNNTILQTSEVAKTLLASSRHKFVNLKNENLVDDVYLIKEVLKQDYFKNQVGISKNQ